MKHYTLAERREMILNGNLLNTIIKLSIPTVIMSVIAAFIPLTDGLFLNNFADSNIAGAVGYSQPFINILTSFSMGLGAASMSIIGQAYGLGNMKLVKHNSLQISIVSCIFAVAIIPFTLIMAVIAKDYVVKDIAGYVWLYISLNSIYLPFLFMASIYNAIKNSTGQPEATLLRVTILLILKVIFNTIFLAILHLDIVGASLATILSYAILAVWMYYDLFIKKSELKLEFNNFRFDKNLISHLFKVAIPSMLSYTLVSLGFILINLEVNAYGVKVLTAQAIASNVNSLCFILPAAVATTITVMVSMNIATGNIKKAKKSLYVGCLVSLVMSALVIVLIWPNTTNVVHLFQRQDKEIITIASHALKIYTLSIIGYGIFMVVQGAFIGLGKTKITLYFGVVRMWLIRYIFILLTKHFLFEDSIFWGNLVSNYVTGLLFLLFILFIKWDITKIKKSNF